MKMKSLRELIQHVRSSRAGRAEASAVSGSPNLLARLPIELHIMLLEYMDPCDAVAALSVSKTLRNVWLSEDVWPWLAERWYPGLSGAVLAATARQRPSLDYPTGDYKIESRMRSPQPAALEPDELFRRMLGKLSRRDGGRYRAALHHSMQLTVDPVFSLAKKLSREQKGICSTEDLDEDLLLKGSMSHSGIPRFMLYSNGRIAWWPNLYAAPYLAVVDDLRTAKRSIYQFPDHGKVQRGYKTAMSNKLLVIARDRTLHAWHLEKDVLATAVMPEEFERCLAEGLSVLIVTRSARLYAWIFGGPLEKIPLDNLDCYQPGPVRLGGLVETPLQSHSPAFHIPRRQGLLLKDNGMLLDFIIHPCLKAVFFVVTMHEGRLIIHEIDRGELVQSYPLHTGSGTTLSAEGWKDSNEYLRWEKCDSYGGYRLFSVFLGLDSELSPSDLQSAEETICTCGRTTGLVSVCFNIYTKTFKLHCHHFLHEHTHLNPTPAAFHLWDNRLYTSFDPSVMQAGMPVTALRCCLASQALEHNAPMGSITVYTTSENSQGLLARRQRASPRNLSFCPEMEVEQETWRRQIEFGLDISAHYASKSVRSRSVTLWNWDKPNVHKTQTIVGDDDFLIYVVDGVYTAWSFGDEITISKETVKWVPWKKASHGM